MVHDDNIDVLALVVSQWTRILVQNPRAVYDRYKAKQIEDDINLFLKEELMQNKVLSLRYLVVNGSLKCFINAYKSFNINNTSLEPMATGFVRCCDFIMHPIG